MPKVLPQVFDSGISVICHNKTESGVLLKGSLSTAGDCRLYPWDQSQRHRRGQERFAMNSKYVLLNLVSYSILIFRIKHLFQL